MVNPAAKHLEAEYGSVKSLKLQLLNYILGRKHFSEILSVWEFFILSIELGSNIYNQFAHVLPSQVEKTSLNWKSKQLEIGYKCSS